MKHNQAKLPEACVLWFKEDLGSVLQYSLQSVPHTPQILLLWIRLPH